MPPVIAAHQAPTDATGAQQLPLARVGESQRSAARMPRLLYLHSWHEGIAPTDIAVRPCTCRHDQKFLPGSAQFLIKLSMSARPISLGDPELEARIREVASRDGMTIGEWLARLIEDQADPIGAAHDQALERTTPVANTGGSSSPEGQAEKARRALAAIEAFRALPKLADWPDDDALYDASGLPR